jgi:predicted membrane protein
MHPVTFVKNHPVGVIVSFAAGMMIGPWLLSTVAGKTGVNINLPTYGSGE